MRYNADGSRPLQPKSLGSCLGVMPWRGDLTRTKPLHLPPTSTGVVIAGGVSRTGGVTTTDTTPVPACTQQWQVDPPGLLTTNHSQDPQSSRTGLFVVRVLNPASLTAVPSRPHFLSCDKSAHGHARVHSHHQDACIQRKTTCCSTRQQQ